MRRIIIIGTAAAVLIAASVADAAPLNKYTASFSFSGGKNGTPSKPKPIGFVRRFGVSSTTPGNRAAPVVEIKTSIDGIKSNASHFATCSSAQILADHLKWDKACPRNSLVATGPSNSILGSGTTLVGAGFSPCHVLQRVYNGGHNKLVHFLSVAPQAPGHICANLKTGAAQPYIGTVSQHGKTWTEDVPLPPDVSTEAGRLRGVYAAIVSDTLTWTKGFQVSTGCKGKRPWSMTFTAVGSAPAGVTPPKLPPVTVKGSSPC